MVIYEITAVVAPERVESYEKYMWEQHIPELMETGHFTAAELTRGESGRYRIRYSSLSHADLDEYLEKHAVRLRADFNAHFPDGVEVAREVWDVLDNWSTASGTR